MADSGDPRIRLADALTDLKDRRGISYEALARRCHLSKSAVHRYCTGRTVPPEFGALERIALACQANRAEIDALFRLWRAADKAARQQSDEPEPEPELESESESVEEKPAGLVPRHNLGRPLRRILTGRAAGILTAAIVAVLVSTTAIYAATRQPRPPDRPDSGPPGSAWMQNPVTVSPEFFGVTMNATTGAMPTFHVGSVRLWDSHTRWADVEPARGQYDWTVLDRMVDGAARSRLPVVFVVGGTPGWAAPNGPLGPYSDRSRTTPPDNPADFDDFLRNVVSRYHGRIGAYQLWELADDPHFYSGDLGTLAEMTTRGSRIVRGIDPAAAVVCPSFGHLDTGAGGAALQRFTDGGGYQQCDAAGVDLPAASPTEPPETLLPLTDSIQRAFHRAGVQPPVWDTGVEYEISLRDRLAPDLARDYAARFYLVGLYARYSRMYFYNWGGSNIPLVLQPEGGPPTAAAVTVGGLADAVSGAAIYSCGVGPDGDLPARVYRCRFLDPTRLHRFDIDWTSSGTATLVPGTPVAVQPLGGPARNLPAGEAITITTTPTIVRQR